MKTNQVNLPEMSQTVIEKLTPEQETLIPFFRKKWQNLVFYTKPIDRKKAEDAVKAAYAIIGYEEPKIVFCDSPSAAFMTILTQGLCRLEGEPEYYLSSQLWHQVRSQLSLQLARLISQHNEELKRLIFQQKIQLTIQLRRKLSSQLSSQMNQQQKTLLIRSSLYIQPEKWAIYGSQSEFCISVLNCTHDSQKWEAFQSLVRDCGWILSFEKVASICHSPIKFKKVVIICERPIKLSLDNEYRLHAEGEPAIQFADGYSMYSYHGVTLPEKYGKLCPNKWQPQWLLEEENAELRRVLIQGIGYVRICQDLHAVELDTWQEYTLLKINSDVDIEPIYLLKMICPSTGRIHALRVPPDITSAKKAITWVNFGINSLDFAEQT